MKKHAFVTGASGFLGRNLVEELARRGWEMTALCLPAEKTESLKRPEVQIVTGNLTDAVSLVAAMPTAPDAEVHCSLNNPSLKHQIEFDWLDDVFKKNGASRP
jgi:nucleoside-diphosphate-sugar epimerase